MDDFNAGEAIAFLWQDGWTISLTKTTGALFAISASDRMGSGAFYTKSAANLSDAVEFVFEKCQAKREAQNEKRRSG